MRSQTCEHRRTAILRHRNFAPSKQEQLKENFSADIPSDQFARLFYDHIHNQDWIGHGHIILLDQSSANYQAAKLALQTRSSSSSSQKNSSSFFQIGGGVNPQNAKRWIDMGASHVIVTSYVFQNGMIQYDKLNELVQAVGGKDQLVLDLSCRKKKRHHDDPNDDDGLYYVGE